MSDKSFTPFRNVVISSLLFTAVAVASFCCWAFRITLFPTEIGLYTSCALVFFGLGGLALYPVYKPKGSREWLGLIFGFVVGFALYAVIWSVAWFSFRDTFGEILGSAGGISIMAALLRKWPGAPVSLFAGIATVFFWHTLGYYTGGYFYSNLQHSAPAGVSAANAITLARLSWGLFYGLGFGIGLSLLLRRPSTPV